MYKKITGATIVYEEKKVSRMLNETGTTDGMKQEEAFESPFQDGNL